MADHATGMSRSGEGGGKKSRGKERNEKDSTSFLKIITRLWNES